MGVCRPDFLRFVDLVDSGETTTMMIGLSMTNERHTCCACRAFSMQRCDYLRNDDQLRDKHLHSVAHFRNMGLVEVEFFLFRDGFLQHDILIAIGSNAQLIAA